METSGLNPDSLTSASTEVDQYGQLVAQGDQATAESKESTSTEERLEGGGKIVDPKPTDPIGYGDQGAPIYADTTGAGVKTQRAVDYELARQDAEKRAGDARLRGDWEAYYSLMEIANDHLKRSLEHSPHPVPDLEPETGPVPPPPPMELPPPVVPQPPVRIPKIK